jgi:hypothetical protein
MAIFSRFRCQVRHKHCRLITDSESTRGEKFRSEVVAFEEAQMLKRIMLTLTFAAAFGAAGLSLTDNANARWWRWNRPYASSYYGYGVPYRSYYYGYGVPYRSYYRGYDYYAPGSYYSTYYGYPNYYYYGRPRVAVRVGGPWWR